MQHRYFLQSLARGLKVLQAIASAPQPLSLSEISRLTDGNNATSTRCCYTLSQLGFVQRDNQRRYSLTPKVLSLGYAAINRLGWRQVAHHYMEQLFEQVRETVNLAVLEGTDILYVDRIPKAKILNMELNIGSRMPAYCTAMGKVLLAWADPAEADRLAQSMDFVALTHRTIRGRTELKAELAKVRAQGYAINDEEFSVGLRSVAAPVLDRHGQPLAAMNIAVRTRDYSRDELESKLAPQAVDTAQTIQEAVGNMETPLRRSRF